MIEQNIEAGVPCRWVAADNVYGVGDIADGDLAYFTTWCPKGTTMQELVNVEGTRWRIEECFETAKNEFGLDHNEARSWHGWHPHVHLVMLAYAVIASVRYQANLLKPKKHNTEHDSPCPLVHSGNQAPRRKTCTTQTTRRSLPQMVRLSTNASGQRYPRSLTT
ncbi:hypothetical protein ACI01nite_27460 [Acetobacter cibinongensis]|uniref:Transposase n=2 Tax=Acetobacter TaxID=434 RepID=A0A0D6N784_9PROT|nr:transposase [Acetobacter cibinongensis]GBQ14648.1 transposase [Acetobacter cibinongensis NRIC 0482]GEL60144.1 hypothetical protein ACI01nite_27460 [Acetobacter cibinongensis]